MKLFFNQKNIFSNNVNSKLSGIYTIIGERSDILVKGSKLDSNYTELILNNSIFTTKDTFINLRQDEKHKYLTINTFNNSEIFSPSCLYIINAENNGSIVNFVSPCYNIYNPLSTILSSDTTLYPASSNLIVKDVMNNGISSLFLDLSGSTLYGNTHFKINSNNIISFATINDQDILGYDVSSKKDLSEESLCKFLPDIVNNLPKNMNGYNYTFEFTNSVISDEVIIFNNFHGGTINLIFDNISTSDAFRNSYKFINCDHINISGTATNLENTNVHALWSANTQSYELLESVFMFDNCQDISISNIKLGKYYALSTTVETNLMTKGNIKEYLNPNVVYLRNSNLKMTNCLFTFVSANLSQTTISANANSLYYDINDSEVSSNLNYITKKLSAYQNFPTTTQYSIAAFNSKILFTSVKFDSHLNLLLDEFSTASDTESILDIPDMMNNHVSSAYIAYENDGLINNGLYNHFHTDYLPEVNSVPIGSVIGYKFWYKKSDLNSIYNDLVTKYGSIVPATDLYGIAAVSASNRTGEITRFPETLLPLCCGPDGFKALSAEYKNQYAILSGINGDAYTSALFSKDALINTITPSMFKDGGTGTDIKDPEYDFYADNILFHSAFCNSINNNWYLKTETELKQDSGITFSVDVNVRSLDNHHVRPPVITIERGSVLNLGSNNYPRRTCSHGGTPWFYQGATVKCNLRNITENMIGTLLVDNYTIKDLENNKIYRTILNNSTITYNTAGTFSVMNILKYLKNPEDETIPAETRELLNALLAGDITLAYSDTYLTDATTFNNANKGSTNYFPISFKYYVFPVLDTYKGNGVLVLRPMTGDIQLQNSVSQSIGVRKGYGGGGWCEYLYAGPGKGKGHTNDTKTYSLAANMYLMPVTYYLTDFYNTELGKTVYPDSSSAENPTEEQKKAISDIYAKNQYYIHTLLGIITNNNIKSVIIPPTPTPVPVIDEKAYLYHYFRQFGDIKSTIFEGKISSDIVLEEDYNKLLNSFGEHNTFDIVAQSYSNPFYSNEIYNKTDISKNTVTCISASYLKYFQVGNILNTNSKHILYLNDEGKQESDDTTIITFQYTDYITKREYEKSELIPVSTVAYNSIFPLYNKGSAEYNKHKDNTIYFLDILSLNKYEFYNNIFNFYVSSFIELKNRYETNNPVSYKNYFINISDLAPACEMTSTPQFDLNIPAFKTYLVYKTLSKICNYYFNKKHKLIDDNEYATGYCIKSETDDTTFNNNNMLSYKNLNNNTIISDFAKPYIIDSTINANVKDFINETINYYYADATTYLFNMPLISNDLDKITVLNTSNVDITDQIFETTKIFNTNISNDESATNNLYVSLFTNNNLTTYTTLANSNLASSIIYFNKDILDIDFANIGANAFNINYIKQDISKTIINSITKIKYNSYIDTSLFFELSGIEFLDLENTFDPASVFVPRTETASAELKFYGKNVITNSWSTDPYTTFTSETSFTTNKDFLDKCLSEINKYQYIKINYNIAYNIYIFNPNKNFTSCYSSEADFKIYKVKNYAYSSEISKTFSKLTEKQTFIATLQDSYNNLYYYIADKANKIINNLLLPLNTTYGLLSYANLLRHDNFIYGIYTNSNLGTKDDYITYFNNGFEGIDASNSKIPGIMKYAFSQSPVISYGENYINYTGTARTNFSIESILGIK